jgi:hypothetical protein
MRRKRRSGLSLKAFAAKMVQRFLPYVDRFGEDTGVMRDQLLALGRINPADGRERSITARIRS